jgi:surface polysaccharide O-acyltransferase-like enzyme
MKANDSKIIEWLRFPLACLIVLLHAQILEPTFRPNTVDSGFAYAVRVFFSEGICRVAVPSFFLISGYLFFKNLEQWDNNIWLGKMKRRFHTLFIPYILWNLLGIAYLCVSPYFGTVTETPGSLVSFFQERGWLRLFWDCNRIMEQWNPPAVNILGITMHNGMPANGPLWFLRDLIVINLCSPVIYVFVKHTRRLGLFVMGILFILNIWFPMEGFAVIGFLFYSVGAYFAIFSKEMVDFFRKVKWLSYVGATVLLILLVVTFGRHGSNQYILRLFQLFGVTATFNLASDLMRKEKSLCTRLADSSFFIYASHIVLISAVTFLLGKLIPSTNQVMLALKYLLSAIITIAVCEGVYQIMKRICPVFLSFICGNRR